MSEAWVVNASPLILFSRIGRFDFIERLAPTILIPTAVMGEVRGGAAKGRTATKALEWAARFEVENVEVPTGVSHWDLGSGESQVIAHAALGTRWAVLDDLAARRCALAHGVPVIGSMGIALRAKRMRLIDEARPLILELIDAGMFLDREFLERILKEVAE